jgi:hypothetical protein
MLNTSYVKNETLYVRINSNFFDCVEMSQQTNKTISPFIGEPLIESNS